MKRFGFLLLFLLALAGVNQAQEIPLQACDGLPVVEVDISGTKFVFLVDTAATSFLNVKTFAQGAARRVPVTSWSGTTETSGQQVTIADLSVGEHHFRNLKLPAIDLSAIGRACGRQLDGIFGIDLLRQLGASVDLHEHTARLLVGSEQEQIRVAEFDKRVISCEEAFNRADESALSDCLDPKVVVFTAGRKDFYGREAAMELFREEFFHQQPPSQVSITLRTRQVLGEAIWVEYDLSIALAPRVVVRRGAALCQKADGEWRAVLLSPSSSPGASAGTGN
jgi:ketosteroid isomerase-like protein